jgi:hypothetical protein
MRRVAQRITAIIKMMRFMGDSSQCEFDITIAIRA